MREFHRLVFVCCLASVLIPTAYADSLVAAYTFDNTLAAVESGVAALTAVDPLNEAAYQAANVFGTIQTAYHFDGQANTPLDEGGLDFNTTGLISSNDYSVEMVLELSDRDNAWRRLLDSSDRQSDDGLSIDPSNNLDDFPSVAGSGSVFTVNSFFDIFVTVDPSNTVAGYFSGVQQFSTTSTSLDVATNTLGFYLDNVVGGGQGEWSSGNVALIKVFDTALTPEEVAEETADPFQGTTPTTTPEPGTWMLMLGGAAGVAAFERRSLSRR